MTRTALVTLLLLTAPSASAADRHWVTGTLRDVQLASTSGGAVTLPMGVGLNAPAITIPLDAAEVVSIEVEGLRYVASWEGRLRNPVINDPVTFAIDGRRLFLRLGGKTHKLTLVKTIRLE
jgi:hypothetical protein